MVTSGARPPRAAYHSGARALKGFCRPYVKAAQGNLVSCRWDGQTMLSFVVDADPKVSGPTEVYVPPHYEIAAVMVNGDACEWTREANALCISSGAGRRHIEVSLLARS